MDASARGGPQVWRYQISLVVVVGVVGREEDPEPVADGDAGGDDEEPVGEPGVSRRERLVGRLPGDEHGHDDRLARARRHLEPDAGQAVIGGPVLGVDAGTEVGLVAAAGGFGQVDGRLRRLALAE